jgi:hypothetical protein
MINLSRAGIPELKTPQKALNYRIFKDKFELEKFI